MAVVIGGIYEHYKHKKYKVIGVANHSETLEKLVVYKALYGNESLWVRPYEMFCDKVIANGDLVDRFSYLGDFLSNTIEIELDISPSINNEMLEKRIDLKEELNKEISDIKFKNKYLSNGKKDAVGIIIASGASISIVILCVTRLLQAIFERPRVLEIDNYDENKQLLRKDVVLIEPSKSTHKTDIDLELGTKYVKLHICDECENESCETR